MKLFDRFVDWDVNGGISGDFVGENERFLGTRSVADQRRELVQQRCGSLVDCAVSRSEYRGENWKLGKTPSKEKGAFLARGQLFAL